MLRVQRGTFSSLALCLDARFAEPKMIFHCCFHIVRGRSTIFKLRFRAALLAVIVPTVSRDSRRFAPGSLWLLSSVRRGWRLDVHRKDLS
jgi:hypothetical protein